MTRVLVTSCTNRKRVAPRAEMRAGDLAPGEILDVASEWARRLRKTAPTTKASGLYCGRSFREAEVAASMISADLYVASAGLGLVPADVVVPSYSLTVASGARDSILDRVTSNASPADWWQNISRRSPFSTSMRALAEGGGGALLVALPSAYLRMLEAELEALPLKCLKRLRIFTGGSSADLPAKIRSYVMPYDARLDGRRSPIPGTRGDFAQRAVRHFASEILSRLPRASADVHAEAVRKCFARLPRPARRMGERRTDAEIEQLIVKYWNRVEGRSSKLLRLLRDELHIACEQSRFRDLFSAVAARRGR